MAKILIVEDDLGLSKMVRDWLVFEKHQVEEVADGNEAREKLRFYEYDLVILDWMLPGMSGVQILREFRNTRGSTPVLMLTGKDTIIDKETGLDAGADDYLTKPFHMKELSARTRALLRRPRDIVTDTIKVGDLLLDRGKHKILKNNVEVKLLPKEFALIDFLMRHPNQVFSVDALLNRVWESESDATADAVTTCVKRIRKKLDSEGKPSIIRTVHGVGYRLDTQE